MEESERNEDGNNNEKWNTNGIHRVTKENLNRDDDYEHDSFINSFLFSFNELMIYLSSLHKSNDKLSFL